MLLSDKYKKQLIRMHEKYRSFGSGSKFRNAVIKALGYEDVLDYGCGKGKLLVNKKYDPAITEFSNEPEPADLVVCTDVLEHIEPDCLDDVLRHIKSKMIKAGFFTISCSPAAKKLPDGRNAHLTVQHPEWWINKLSEFFVIEKSSFRVDERKLAISVELEVHLKPLGVRQRKEAV